MAAELDDSALGQSGRTTRSAVKMVAESLKQHSQHLCAFDAEGRTRIPQVVKGSSHGAPPKVNEVGSSERRGDASL
jgi:hypothetical protein